MTDQNNAAQAAEQTIRRVLELYAESYDTMTRIAQREGREPVVSPVSVAVDIRRNMVNAVAKALSKLRAEGVQAGDERAAFEAWHEQHYGKPPLRQINSDKYVGEHQERWTIWQARAALASAPVAEPRLEWSAKALYGAIKEVLLNHRLSNLVGDDGEFFPLVDHLCSKDAKSVESGEFEIALICDAIYNDVLTKSAPVAGEAQPAIGYLNRNKGRTDWAVTRAAYDLPDGIYMLYAAPQASEAVRNAAPEGAGKGIEDGSFLHEDAPAARLAREAAKVIRALKAQPSKDGGGDA